MYGQVHVLTTPVAITHGVPKNRCQSKVDLTRLEKITFIGVNATVNEECDRWMKKVVQFTQDVTLNVRERQVCGIKINCLES